MRDQRIILHMPFYYPLAGILKKIDEYAPFQLLLANLVGWWRVFFKIVVSRVLKDLKPLLLILRVPKFIKHAPCNWEIFTQPHEVYRIHNYNSSSTCTLSLPSPVFNVPTLSPCFLPTKHFTKRTVTFMSSRISEIVTQIEMNTALCSVLMFILRCTYIFWGKNKHYLF